MFVFDRFLIKPNVKIEMIKRPFSKKQIQTLRKVLDERPRDLTLLNVGVDTALRGGDLLGLKVSDVKTEWGEIRESFYVKMKKTGKQVLCELSQNSILSLERWLKVSNKDTDDFIFTSIRGGSVPITAVHFRRIIKSWCDECGWDEKFFSSHSIRKSLPTELYKQTKDLRSCQILLGHQSIGNTAHYLGINEESAFDLIRKHRI